MFSFGWPELLLIGVVVLLVVGPQDIPKVMYGLGRIAQRLGYIRYIFTQRFDDFMQSAELETLQDKAQARDHDPETSPPNVEVKQEGVKDE